MTAAMGTSRRHDCRVVRFCNAELVTPGLLAKLNFSGLGHENSAQTA
jgi:hypothetical protein